jgi:hypothetical protein
MHTLNLRSSHRAAELTPYRLFWLALGFGLHYLASMKKAKQPATEVQDKLTKADPEFYSKIAKLAGTKLARERGTKYFSRLAKKSHPRAEYHGGRPRKLSDAQ